MGNFKKEDGLNKMRQFEVKKFAYLNPFFLMQRTSQELGDSIKRIGRIRNKIRESAEEGADEVDSGLSGTHVVVGNDIYRSKKFEELYRSGNWSEDQIIARIKICKLMRRVLITFSFFVVVILMAISYFSASIYSIILAPLSIVVTVGSIAGAVKMSWWEFCLNNRKIMPINEYLKENDIISAVLK